MNARQKAKRFKRLYEEMLKQPIPKFTVTNYKIDTLRFERLYPDVIIQGNESRIIDTITKDLAHELVEQMDKYVTITTNFEPHVNKFRVVGEVKVAHKY